jgi:hypothetical protein
MSDPPSRNIRPARSRRRQSWSVHGGRTVEEKDAFGAWINDIEYAFGDVSGLSLPILAYVAYTGNPRYFGVTYAALLAWMTMVVSVGTIRGGWVVPLATDIHGWVSLKPSLILLRIFYYNIALAVAIYASTLIGLMINWPPITTLVAILIGAVAIGLFPRLADEYYRYLSK